MPLVTEEIDDIIVLSDEDKDRIYTSWIFSIIIKLFKKNLAYGYLRTKQLDLWKPSEPLIVVDLGNGYYIAKFTNQENMQRGLHGGPWFITGDFLLVRHWEPNFTPEAAKTTHTAIWVRLPSLPIEFYDKSILESISHKLGTLLKIDTCTPAALRGLYARIYIQVPLDTLVKTYVTMGNHRQNIVYEGEGVLCIRCGKLGDTHKICPTQATTTQNKQDKNGASTSSSAFPHNEWQTINFNKRKTGQKVQQLQKTTADS
ncbi:uncharacterized protein LOC124889733 [Capsicum annuum]|uniref:uncharacterized protein LOC124889733 n=1 Tax=Capsicum annuum TaxID=4072 RepID=UPI001FB1787F|nr:uncharacterized protein LOC124889733 [Capsicum annuum]